MLEKHYLTEAGSLITGTGKRPRVLKVNPRKGYIIVADLAKAHIVAVDRMIHCRTKADCEIFNLGTGNGFSVLEVIRSFEKVTGQKLKYKMVERRPGDIEKVWADTSLANEELGWKAEKNLDDMMQSAWKWELALARDLPL